MRPLLDKTQLAKLLNVSVSWVEKATAARQLPIVWVGGCARYDVSDIEAWLADNKEFPTSGIAPVVGLFGPKKPAPPQPTNPPKAPKPPAGPIKPRPPSGPRRADGAAA